MLEETPGSQDQTRRNPADNLSLKDRARGGVRSAAMQTRDKRGQFSGQRQQQGRGNPGEGQESQPENSDGNQNPGSQS